MARQEYNESVYKFTDPVRLFKANDPYYFEVDNLPLKQLQENCLWLKDQIRRDVIKITDVNREDIQELRPYALGGDRVVRVKPGRFTARINDVSKRPLAYLKKALGFNVGEIDTYEAALPNPGTFSTRTTGAANALLTEALDTFKSKLAQDSLGLNGLAERAFTWPMENPDNPILDTGADVRIQSSSRGGLGYTAIDSPMLVTEALLWAKSRNSVASKTLLTTYDNTNPALGLARLPRTESFFIKKWRGVARTAIVDVPNELTVEVPQFDPTDFSYLDESGRETPVPGVTTRIDMVFIYSKPVDAESVKILNNPDREIITTPTLGIVRGAGLKVNFEGTTNYDEEYLYNTGIGDTRIVASPGDSENDALGFTAASGNDIAYDVRGTFPSPDDLLNIAPLLSQRLESEAYELIGQSILPVAYVWVTNGSTVVSTTDVIDIRPFFRTAELSYNERAGLAAATPQLSLANPAVGKVELDYELKRQHDSLKSQIDNLEATIGENVGPNTGTRTVATGYVFGGWNFGPEGALYDFYSRQSGADEETVKNIVRSKYGISLPIPRRPDWDLANWAERLAGADEAGAYPNDYINTFFSQNTDNRFPSDTQSDAMIAGGSASEYVGNDGLNSTGGEPTRAKVFNNAPKSDRQQRVRFNYIKKRINFDRASYPGLVDYNVDISFLNCVPQCGGNNSQDYAFTTTNPEGIQGNAPANYFGHWVEKGPDYFTIYVAFSAPTRQIETFTTGPPSSFYNTNARRVLPYYPAPHRVNNESGGGSVVKSERGGERFSSFLVLTEDLLLANENPQSPQVEDFGAYRNHQGYDGNPRAGKCTYPTITWSMKAISEADLPFHYGTLQAGSSNINLNQG